MTIKVGDKIPEGKFRVMTGEGPGWKSTDDVKANWEIERKFDPHMSDKDRDHRRARWNEALRRAQDWEERSSVDVTPQL